jgi:lysozyme
MSIMAVYLPGPNGVEGTIHTPIRDIGGHWTVCTGHDGPDIIPGKYYSDAECAALLQKDLAPVKKSVDAAVKIPIDAFERAALYSLAFHDGIGAFRNSIMLKDVNAGDKDKACNDFKAWVYVTKKVNGKAVKVINKGLVNRADIDQSLCMMGQAE